MSPDSNAPTEARIEVAIAPGEQRYAFLVIGHDGAFTHVCPASGTIVVGRGTDADVRIDDGKASRRHALVHLGEAGQPCTIEDCGSLNRTRLGERDLVAGERTELHIGDRITIGTTTLILQREPLARPEPRTLATEGGFQQRVGPTLERIAASDLPVLVLGETGVGKEVLSRAIHERSPRAKRPLVCLNCAALSEALLESELFGHEKGSFTGATAAKEGLLESAQGGTVFLDEIGEMPLTLQVKLLRVLEQREVQRVGSLRPRPIDVRFIAATHRDLEVEIEKGRFRQDLYFRLNGVAVAIPPLRERLDELEPLARGFVDQACVRSHRSRRPRLARSALEAMRAYPWPGNIRELRNVMERAVVLCEGDEIGPELLPQLRSQRPSLTPHEGLRPLEVGNDRPADERERIIAALAAHDGNQTHAAKALGISRRTLISRIEEYDLPRPRKR